MQTVYAAHLPLADLASDQIWETATTLMADWVQDRFDVAMAADPFGTGNSDQGRVEWMTLQGRSGAVLSVVADKPDGTEVGWRWRTLLDLGTEQAGGLWLRVRVGLLSEAEGLLTRPRVAVGRPGVVRLVADRVPVTVDGWRLGEWRPVQEQHVDDYLAFLRDPHRKLPVVVLSEHANGQTFVDPGHLADRLLGLAHVVTVDMTAAYRVSDELGKTLSCFLGAVRVYWPGFTDKDDPYHHRLFVAGTLSYLGPDGVERELFDMLGRLAGLSLDEPSLRRRLKIERRAAELEDRVTERLQARALLASAPLTSEGGVDAETWEAFAADYDAVQAQLQELELAGLETEMELEILREERDDARAQLLEVVRSLGKEGRQPLPGVDEPPTSVGEAVSRAAARAGHVVFLPEAFSSAAASQYDDPPRVLADLEVIEQVAREWAAGDLPAGPHAAFKERCSSYRNGIGQKASTRYRSDYERNHEGMTIMLEPHLARGVGAVAAILRIYMYFDTERRQIVVGHVGRKLRDDSNRN